MTKIKAFTLIELLVVMAIIAILVAITLPTFRTVQETGRSSKCANNLKQIGAGLLLYAQDHDNNFPTVASKPVSWVATPSSGTTLPWTQQIASYVGNPNDPAQGGSGNIFTCPSSSQTYTADKYYSYFFSNHAAVARAAQYSLPTTALAVKTTLITHPAELILGGDVTDSNTGISDANKSDYTAEQIDVQLKPTIHNGSINLLFADGHVEGVRWDATPTAQGFFDPARMTTIYQGIGQPAYLSGTTSQTY